MTDETNVLAVALFSFPSLADYERIDAEADNDEEYAKLLEPMMEAVEPPVVDQFYRVI